MENLYQKLDGAFNNCDYNCRQQKHLEHLQNTYMKYLQKYYSYYFKYLSHKGINNSYDKGIAENASNTYRRISFRMNNIMNKINENVNNLDTKINKNKIMIQKYNKINEDLLEEIENIKKKIDNYKSNIFSNKEQIINNNKKGKDLKNKFYLYYSILISILIILFIGLYRYIFLEYPLESSSKNILKKFISNKR